MDFYEGKDVPHGEVRSLRYFSNARLRTGSTARSPGFRWAPRTRSGPASPTSTSFPILGSFSGTVLASMDVKNSYGGALNNASEFNKRVRLLFIAAGTAEESRLKAAHHAREEFEKGGIKYVWYESPGTAHEWPTCRRDLNEFAPRPFRDCSPAYRRPGAFRFQETIMHTMIRRSVQFIVLALAFSLISGQAQRPDRTNKAGVSDSIAAKKPVFAGACKACPWGILAKVTADALSFYGYQTTICWVCWSSFGRQGAFPGAAGLACRSFEMLRTALRDDALRAVGGDPHHTAVGVTGPQSAVRFRQDAFGALQIVAGVLQFGFVDAEIKYRVHGVPLTSIKALDSIFAKCACFVALYATLSQRPSSSTDPRLSRFALRLRY